jgi:GT2 family glycosyltransferase
MSREPFVSIILVNYNGKHYLGDCLRSLLSVDYREFELVFVDNASTDGSVDFVKSFFPHSNVKVVVADRNYGFAGGNNIGVRYVDPSAKYVVFLNNDTVVDKGWLRALVDVMEKDPLVGAAQSKVMLLRI